MFNRIVAAVAARWHPTSFAKRDLVRTALWHLEDVVYSRLREAGFMPGGIIDIGACSGVWSRNIRSIFSTPILMIEAREAELGDLQRVCAVQPNTEFNIALLGAEDRNDVEFQSMSTASSLFSEMSDMPRVAITLNMTTLDTLIASTKFSDPLFLKLDVQGAELEVLRGGLRTLARSEVVQLELPFVSYNKGAPTAREVLDFMDDHDFIPFEIAGFVRPHDKFLVQVDVLFIKKNSSLRPSFFSFFERL